MKNALIFVLVLLVMIVSVPVFASVTGECVNCHTMHNSQGGSTVASSGLGAAWDSGTMTGGSSDAAQQHLLVSDCVGCHSSTGNETILPLGSSNVPIVYNVSEPTNPLAGGNFYWVTLDQNNGHNVYGISSQDTAHASAPGSDVSAAGECANCHGSLATASTNSGCNGCHLAQHHADDTDSVANGGDGWYRFLGNSMSGNKNSPGVIGIEDSTWEQNPTSAQHNVYKGTATTYGEGDSNPTQDGSIGSYCSGCHSVFHAEMGTSGAWVRHPSDIVLPDDATKEYKGYTVYNPLVPVARQVIVDGATSNNTVTPGSDMVTCISCHRAHGSPYGDMLRWDYQDGCVAGTSSAECGCFACHTTKGD